MNNPAQKIADWWQAIEIYRRPKVLAVFSMGIASGFPITLILATLGIWLSQEGISKSTIGLLALVTIPYSLKVLWGPLMDGLRLPVLHRLFGRRRSWLFVVQVGLGVSIFLLGSVDPADGAWKIGVAAFFLAIMSASQDLVIDAYRIEILEDEEMPAGAAMTQFGYRIGNFIAGAGALYLASEYDWHVAYWAMIALLLCGCIPALLCGEPMQKGQALIAKEQAVIKGWLARQGNLSEALKAVVENFYVMVVVPFKEYISRRGWWVILLFIVLLKIGDGMAAIMTSPLMVDLNFTNMEIIYANKSVGFIALLVGIFSGGVLLKYAGTYRGFMIAAVLMMVSNLSFAVLNELGHNVNFLAFTIAFENFSSGLGGTLAIAYLSGLCNLAYTATQYALLTSFASMGRNFLSAPSGYLQEYLGWTDFFIFTTFAALPGVILLLVMKNYGFVSDEIRSVANSNKA